MFTEKTFKEFDKIETQDFFEKMKELTLIKQKLCMIYPNETKLILGMINSNSSSVKKELEEIRIKTLIDAKGFQDEMIKGMVIPCDIVAAI